jgi:CBS domain-containing protein
MKVREAYQPSVLGATEDETLVEAARRMRGFGVGSLAVLENERLIGIITERDLVRAIVDGADMESSPIAGYMSSAPESIGLNESTDVATTAMVRLGARHLPVVDGTRVIGMLSIRDLLLSADRIKARSRAKKDRQQV